jgi:hypothetical protein
MNMKIREGILMAGCSPWKYKRVNAQVFQALRQKGEREGFAIPNKASGSFTIKAVGMNVGFTYVWKESLKGLTLQCVSKPMISCSMIKGIADNIIRECGGKPS